MARPLARTFVLFNHDDKSVRVIGPKPKLQRVLDDAIAKAKRFVTTGSGSRTASGG